MPAAPAQAALEAGTCASKINFFNLSAFIWFDFFKIIFNSFSECSLGPFFLVRDLSKAGAERKYYQARAGVFWQPHGHQDHPPTLTH